MQGLWKSGFSTKNWFKDYKHKTVSRKNFLKDKSKIVFKKEEEFDETKRQEIFGSSIFKQSFKNKEIKEVLIENPVIEYNSKYIYYDYHLKAFKEFETNNILDASVIDYNSSKSGLIQIKGNQLTALKELLKVTTISYNHNYINIQPNIMYGKQINKDFWKKYFNYSKTYCKCLANKRTRSNQKIFLKQILLEAQNNLFDLYDYRYENTHDLDKSIGWCVS